MVDPSMFIDHIIRPPRSDCKDNTGTKQELVVGGVSVTIDNFEIVNLKNEKLKCSMIAPSAKSD